MLLSALAVALALWTGVPADSPKPSKAAKAAARQSRQALEKAGRAARAGNQAEAERLYAQAVQLDPSCAQAWLELGRIQFAAGRNEQAGRSLKSAVAADPKLGPAYLAMFKVAQAADDWKGLVDVASRLIKVDPVTYSVAYLALAVGHFNLRELEPAEKNVREAIRMDDRNKLPETRPLLAIILAQRRDYAGAAEQMREHLKHWPSAPDAQALRAKLAEWEARAGENNIAGATGATFRVDTELALIRFQVSPRRGAFVTDLRPEDIEIREDGAPQKTVLFEGGRFYPRKAPIDISLLFDCSGSVQAAGTLDPHVFEAGILDEYENASIAIYGFSDELVRLTGHTRQPQLLKQAMDGVMAIRAGTTPLFEYIEETVRWSASRPGAIRILIVFSDGESTKPGDDGRVDHAIAAAKEAGMAVFPVLLNAPIQTLSALPLSSAAPNMSAVVRSAQAGATSKKIESVAQYMNLAEATGGEASTGLSSHDALPNILKALAGRMKYDYVAGYYPVSSGKKKRHDVEVVLRSKDRGEITGGKRIVVH